MAEVGAGSGTGAAHPVSAITPTVPSRTANSLARIAFSFVRVNRQASEDPTGPVVAAAVADGALSAQSEGVRLLMISDTHLPVRAKKLPDEVWGAVAAADVVFHAGDWVGVELLDELEERATRLVACWGNNDGTELRARLPEVARVELAGMSFAVVHETGTAAGRERRCELAYPDVDVLVFGHSHIPWDTTTPRGLRLLNPGSPTDRRRQPYGTFLTATLGASGLDDVVLHPVGRARA
jgi:putative phosphoesterase